MIRVFGVDVIIEEDTLEMIELMLKNDGKITVGFDDDLFVFQCIIGLDLDSGGAVDESFVFFDDGKTSLAGT